MGQYTRYWHLAFLLTFAGPYKIIGMALLPLWALYYCLNNKFDNRVTALVLSLIVANLIVSMAFNGTSFILNGILMILFLCPLLLQVCARQVRQSRRALDKTSVQWIFEAFFKIQLIFCFISIISNYVGLSGFDTAFGDNIAGTFRNPLSLKADASNTMFVFMMLLLIPTYVHVFHDSANKLIVALSIFCVFAASSNHLVISAILASILVIGIYYRKRFSKVMFSFAIAAMLLITLYSILQPENLSMIQERIGIIIDSIGNISLLEEYSLKAVYSRNLINYLSENISLLFSFGVGAGTISSRAALFFTGDYIDGFTFTNLSVFGSNYMQPLLETLKNSPPWLAGAFNYPYNGNFSLIAEIGIIASLLLIFRLWKRLDQVFGKSPIALYLIAFISTASFVDNYYEYFHVYVIFFTLLTQVERLKIE